MHCTIYVVKHQPALGTEMDRHDAHGQRSDTVLEGTVVFTNHGTMQLSGWISNRFDTDFVTPQHR